jgi:peroxiredoxin Q/BCP
MATLQPGDKAPDFTANDQNGQPVSLADFKGKNGCTAESCDFRDNYQSLTGKGFEVIGVSVDSEKSHKKFETKYQLPFTLIADTEHQIVEAYGVWVEKSMYGKTYMGTARKTFIINADGIIDKIIDKVDTKNSSQQVLDLLD